jgi:outer membrane receptor protein involved in Fe transport
MTQFNGKPCNPTVGRVDYGKWITGPRKAYTMFGSGTFDFNDHVTAFSNFNFASSNTVTRREPAPYLGPGFSVAIPFHTTQGGDAIYLPSVVTSGTAAAPVGSTKVEYRAGGTRGTNCPAMGGCTMAQAFPVSPELRTLLESRPGTATIGPTGPNATNPFRGLSACNRYSLAVNTVAAGVRTNPNGNAAYLTEIDPNTGQFLATCGPNSGWLLNQQLTYFPPRGTDNTERLYQFAAGLRGDLGLSDWTWEAYTSYGDSQTQTNYIGFSSMANYAKIMSAPNYGKGFSETGVSSKYLTCTSGLNPFDPALKVSQDCLDAIAADEIDRNSMLQRIYEITTQGHVFELPAGEVRAALGASYRRNDYKFTPDALRAAAYTNDAAAAAFASGSIDEHVTVKEGYGELLVPLLKDLPLIKSLELELGARHSEYSTGQKVDTYKALASWSPVQWMRARGGYNRAERAPNMSELFATPSGSAQFSSGANDPCRADNAQATAFAGATPGTTTNNLPQNPNRAQLRALCSAQINAWGGNNSSDFQVDPDNFLTGGGGALIVGNPNLKNERGDTWTMGLALSSPFTHPLLSRISATFDWYEARVTDPIEVQQTGQVVNSCFNVNGLNPTYSLDDPLGFCKLIERDPSTGGITRVYNQFGNQGQLVIRGVDFTMRWSAALSDLGLESLPGTLGLNISGNYLIDQIQRYGANLTDDYAGYGGASRIRSSTDLRYTWGRGNRVSITWQYREGTQTASGFATALSSDGQNGPNLHRNPLLAGYHTTNMFNGTVGTKIGPVSASLSINNLLNTKPSPGGYDLRDPLAGFGSFSPFDDLIGRRYSINLSMDF